MASPKPISRFANLELASPVQPLEQTEDELKGETYYFVQAQNAYAEGLFEPALRAFAKVLEYNAQNAAAWAGQVRMLIELGEFREAKIWVDKALERFPHFPELLAAKAVALARTGDLKGALAFSDAAFEERGDTPYIWLARADVLLARREKRAEYCFGKAHQLAPEDWLMHWLASRIQFYYQKFALALKLAQQALAADASRSVVWFQIGLCQRELGLISLAQGSFEQALQLNPSSVPARLGLNRLHTVTWTARLLGFWRRIFLR
jgi:tetratricopeptide (TPR) repeat protein